MKKHLLLLSISFIALTSMAQTPTGMSSGPPQGMPTGAGMFNQLTITNGQANIDGKNASSCVYNYTGSDSAWTANLTNITDKEAIVILYTKTTASNLVVTFPAGSIIKQPTAMAGVTLSGTVFTLSSSDKGTFNFMIQKNGTAYTVQIARTAQ